MESRIRGLRGMADARLAGPQYGQLAGMEVGDQTLYVDIPVFPFLGIEYLDAAGAGVGRAPRGRPHGFSAVRAGHAGARCGSSFHGLQQTEMAQVPVSQG